MEGTTFKVFSLKQEVIANCPAPRFISYKTFHALFQKHLSVFSDVLFDNFIYFW